AMALTGIIFERVTRLGYEAFIFPVIFGVIASLPLLVKYSRRDLSLKQIVIRNVLHFLLLEMIILSTLWLVGILTSLAMTVSLGFSVLLINLTVHLVLWVHDRRTARQFNDALKQLQHQISRIK
ncbi:MAG: hypothetical protein PHP40_06715, partial [Eubacteriales bacterium]|nr:hypothetical protein [Eubacteriales bacterium]